MTPRGPLIFLVSFLLPIAIAASWLHADVTDEQVGQAIEKMKAYLYSKQDVQSGSWEFRSRSGGVESDALQVGGETALVTLALLISGESPQNPMLARAIQFLRSLEMKGTYAVAIRAHVWANLPPEYLPLLEVDASWLLQSAGKHKLGLFDYQPMSSDRVDHSVTQYGMLGMWEASKRGLKIPRKYWEGWVQHFVNSQRPDGGWAYGNNPDGITTGSMTAAGLTALFVGQQELYRTNPKPEPKVTEAIEKGVAWLDQRFEGHNNPGGNEWTYYYLYGIERVALGSGIRFLNGKDWYQAGATHIIYNIRPNGSIEDDYVNTSFALMFLSRGRVPVWVNKLQVPGIRCNNRPSDVYSLTQFLSNQIEKEINWQSISVDHNPDDWLVAPVAYLASNERVELTQKQKDNLKTYLDMGGLLLASPDGHSPEFSDSIRVLAKELYPRYEFQPVKPGGILLNSWHRLPDPGKQPVLHSLSNGAREIIVLAGQDWSEAFQADKDPGKSLTWDLATNVFAYATDRGALDNRLAHHLEAKTGRSMNENATVGRARYEGNWLPEPAMWGPLGNYVFNRSGVAVTVTDAEGGGVLDLDRIGKVDYKLIHLTGTHSVFLTDAQKTAIQQYLGRGGTILVETVGGQGDFSRSIEKQLSAMFNNAFAVPLTVSDPIISGKGLDGGQDCSRSVYRRYAVVKLQFDPQPRLAAFLDQNSRPMVILSHEDLSLGSMGTRHWNVSGYQPEPARRLMTNIVLWAQKQRMKN